MILKTQSPSSNILHLANGHIMAQCIAVTAELGVADLIENDSKHYDELAKHTGVNSGSLHRMLTILAELDILEETEDNEFRLRPMGQCLLSNSEYSLRSYLRLINAHFYAPWSNLNHTIRTGESGYVQLHGMPPYAYLKQHQEIALLFDNAMIELSRMHDHSILQAYDFSQFNTLVDLGGGIGLTTFELLKQNPKLQVILFEQQEVIERAQDFLQEQGYAERCQFVGGSFFDAVPTNADCYFIRNVLNDWDDENAVKILKNCHQSMNSNSRLLLALRVNDKNASFDTKALNLQRLLMHSAKVRVRTLQELQHIISASGFVFQQIIDTETDYKILEATPT